MRGAVDFGQQNRVCVSLLRCDARRRSSKSALIIDRVLGSLRAHWGEVATPDGQRWTLRRRLTVHTARSRSDSAGSPHATQAPGGMPPSSSRYSITERHATPAEQWEEDTIIRMAEEALSGLPQSSFGPEDRHIQRLRRATKNRQVLHDDLRGRARAGKGAARMLR